MGEFDLGNAGGNIPTTQLDALPLLSASQYGHAVGQLITIGGQTVRYFSPDDLDLKGKALNTADADTTGGTWRRLLSKWIDAVGCTKYTLVGACEGGTTAVTIKLYVCQAGIRSGGAVIDPPRTGTFGAAGNTLVGSLVMPALAVGATGAVACGWQVGIGVYDNNHFGAGLGKFKLWLSVQSAYADTTTITCQLWGTS